MVCFFCSFAHHWNNIIVIMNIDKNKIGCIAIALISMLGIVGIFMLAPIAQDIGYHTFVDKRTIIGIPNFWNVTSNIPFLFVGLMGLHTIFYTQKIIYIVDLKIAYILFFVGVSLVAFGSGYYHLWPDNGSLVWDRLPMTIAFMALFSIIIGEFVSIKIGKFMLWPLVIFGAISVVYWHITESNGEGDLRLYVLVQVLPMLLIPIILFLFKPKFTHLSGYWYLLCAYVLAKVLEHFDQFINNILFSLSGHSLKHVVAALGILFLLKAYNKRQLI